MSESHRQRYDESSPLCGTSPRYPLNFSCGRFGTEPHRVRPRVISGRWLSSRPRNGRQERPHPPVTLPSGASPIVTTVSNTPSVASSVFSPPPGLPNPGVAISSPPSRGEVVLSCDAARRDPPRRVGSDATTRSTIVPLRSRRRNRDAAGRSSFSGFARSLTRLDVPVHGSAAGEAASLPASARMRSPVVSGSAVGGGRSPSNSPARSAA